MRRGGSPGEEVTRDPKVLASNSGSTFEATKTNKRRSECIREISLRLELSIIKVKVRFTGMS